MLRFVALGCLCAALSPVAASATVFPNPTPIPIPDGASTLYPSQIVPTGLTGFVQKVSVTLTGFTHSFVGDVDILLVAPNGAKLVLMSDSCSTQSANLVDFTFDDLAATPMPADVCALNVPYQPFNNVADNLGFSCADDPDVFPAPAPAGPGAGGGYPTGPQSFSVFNGMPAVTAMEAWSLYVFDDCADETGSIAGGWSLDITTAVNAARVLSFGGAARTDGVRLSWRTGSEVDVAGFNVYRTGPAGTVRVNRSVIPAGTMGVGSYGLVDRTARAGVKYAYRLQTVGLDGKRTWAGRALLRAR